MSPRMSVLINASAPCTTWMTVIYLSVSLCRTRRRGALRGRTSGLARVDMVWITLCSSQMRCWRRGCAKGSGMSISLWMCPCTFFVTRPLWSHCGASWSMSPFGKCDGLRDDDEDEWNNAERGNTSKELGFKPCMSLGK